MLALRKFWYSKLFFVAIAALSAFSDFSLIEYFLNDIALVLPWVGGAVYLFISSSFSNIYYSRSLILSSASLNFAYKVFFDFIASLIYFWVM